MKPPRYYDALTGIRSARPPEAVLGSEASTASHLFGPAFFDPQVNGFAGIDFQNPDLESAALEWAVGEIRRAGCSHFLLTLITHGVDFLEAQLARVRSLLDHSALLRETIVGFHLEGPFLSDRPGYAGAHSREHLIPPNWNLFERLQRAAAGYIRLVTLAPELPGSIPFIERATAAGVWVGIGHTNATMDELLAAVRAGARLATHLGNGCPMELPRHDNIIQRLLAIPELIATVIPDGVHVPPPALGNLVRALGSGRLAMTTDSMSAAAAPPGMHRLGELELRVGDDGIVALEEGGQYAGSSLRMVDGFYNLVRLGGLDATGAWRACTHLRRRMFPEIDPPLLILPCI